MFGKGKRLMMFQAGFKENYSMVDHVCTIHSVIRKYTRERESNHFYRFLSLKGRFMDLKGNFW